MPIVDTDDENVDDNSKTNESGGGLSPPSGNSGDGGGNEVDNEDEGEGGIGGGDHEGEDGELDPYHETPPNYKCYRNLTDMDHFDNSLIETGGNVHNSEERGKGNKMLQLNILPLLVFLIVLVILGLMIYHKVVNNRIHLFFNS